jgi:hypothetical protein
MCLNNNNKSKTHAITCHAGTEGERKCSYTLSLTLALEGAVVKATPQPLYPGNDLVSIVLEARWASQPVRSGAENLSLPAFDHRTVQFVASRYTQYAIPAHNVKILDT